MRRSQALSARRGCRRRPPPRRARLGTADDPRILRREERPLRADARLERNLRPAARSALGLHATPLRMVPGRAVLAARPELARRRARPDRRGRRDGAARARDRQAPRLAPHRCDRGSHRHPPSVSRLARRPRQPGDPGRVPARLDHAARPDRTRAAFAVVVRRPRCDDGCCDPRQLPPPASPRRPRGVRGVAAAGRPPDGRGRRSS